MSLRRIPFTTRRRPALYHFAILLALGHAPRALACATCFAGADSDQTTGLNLAIGVLLGALTVLMLLFSGVAWGISRNLAAAGEEKPAAPSAPFPKHDADR